MPCFPAAPFREKWETHIFLLYPSFGDCLFLNEWSHHVPGGVLWWCFTGVWSLVTSPNPVTVSDSQPASTRQAGVTECTAAEVYFLYFSATFNRISHVECQVTHNWAAAIQLECQNVQLYTKQLKRFSHLENISRQLKNWKCLVELFTKYKCLTAIDLKGIEQIRWCVFSHKWHILRLRSQGWWGGCTCKTDH